MKPLLSPLICLMLALCIALPAKPIAASRGGLADNSALVSVDDATTFGALPSDFIGLSYEASLLAEPQSFPTRQGNLAALFNLLGQGNLRIGGNSVDRHTFWQSEDRTPPGWATALLKPADIDRLAQFSKASGWKVELAVNLGYLDPTAIHTEGQYAQAALGEQLVALECGNEPNDYRVAIDGIQLRPAIYGYAQYHADFMACANAIGRGIPLAGPDTSGAFLAALTFDEGSRLSLLTQHAYTLCNVQTPSVTDLLSAATDRAEIAKVQPTLLAGRAGRLPLRLDETNSVGCGSSSAGVGDVYAASLWAIDYSLLMAQQGVNGVNFHGGLGLCPHRSGPAGWYTPLCATSSDNLQQSVFTLQPLYYGLLFTHLLGSGQFYRVNVSTAANLTAYALRGNDGQSRVMLIEKDAPSGSPITVNLHVGTRSNSAQVLHLTGSALTNNQDIAIQGTTVDPSGHFMLPAPDLLGGSNGVYTFSLATGSAALITWP